MYELKGQNKLKEQMLKKGFIKIKPPLILPSKHLNCILIIKNKHILQWMENSVWTLS